jgi:hypothetical protein
MFSYTFFLYYFFVNFFFEEEKERIQPRYFWVLLLSKVNVWYYGGYDRIMVIYYNSCLQIM